MKKKLKSKNKDDNIRKLSEFNKLLKKGLEFKTKQK
jgi:hypothetical protein